MSLPVGLGANMNNASVTGVPAGLSSMGNNQSDYDPFGDYMSNQQQQQQLFQALAAFAAAACNQTSQASQNSYENNNNSSSNGNNQRMNQSRSLLENIEALNSKFMNQKQQMNTSFGNGGNLDQNNNSQNNNNNNEQMGNFSSQNSKRQSLGGMSSLNQANLFSTPIPISSSPTSQAGLAANSSGYGNNNRLNSTPNFDFTPSNTNSNAQNR
jgi:hypothetical protein